MADAIDTSALVAFHNEILSAKKADGTPLYDVAYRMTSANYLHSLIAEQKKNSDGK
jgi:hypothetical protein